MDAFQGKCDGCGRFELLYDRRCRRCGQDDESEFHLFNCPNCNAYRKFWYFCERCASGETLEDEYLSIDDLFKLADAGDEAKFCSVMSKCLSDPQSYVDVLEYVDGEVLCSVLLHGTAGMARAVLGAECRYVSARRDALTACSMNSLKPEPGWDSDDSAPERHHDPDNQCVPVLALAMKNKDPGMVDVVREAGVVPGLRDLAYAAAHQDAELARRILELGKPQVPDIPGCFTHQMVVHEFQGECSQGNEDWICPVLCTLEWAAFEHANAAGAVRLMEILVEAGYQPTVFDRPRLWVETEDQESDPEFVARYKAALQKPAYDPLKEQPQCFDVEGRGRYAALAMQQPAWSPMAHSRWPCAFKAAVQQLLLGAGVAAPRAQKARHRRGRRLKQLQRSSPLAALPQDVLMRIVAAAAYPVSAWMS